MVFLEIKEELINHIAELVIRQWHTAQLINAWFVNDKKGNGFVGDVKLSIKGNNVLIAPDL